MAPIMMFPNTLKVKISAPRSVPARWKRYKNAACPVPTPAGKIGIAVTNSPQGC